MKTEQPQRYLFSIIQQRYNQGAVGHTRRYVVAPGYRIPLHNHDFYEIECGCEGHAIQTLNGVAAPFRSSDVFLLRPDDSHEIHADGDASLTFINIAFEASHLDFIYERYHLESIRAWQTAPDWTPLHRLSAKGLSTVRQGLFEMLNDTRNAFSLDRFLFNFFFLLENEAKSPYGECPEWLQQTLQRLHDPQWMRMGPRALEKISGYTLEYVSRVLKKCAGVTPRDALNRIRMEHAALCLNTTARDICQIARDCGFESASYFFRLFREHYGCTPLQYRGK